MSFFQLRSTPKPRSIGGLAPSVTTNSASEVTGSTATGNGSLDSQGTGTVSELGVVWSTAPNPTIADSKATAVIALGAFTASITGLSEETNYHYRAYAINEFGITYGEDVEFVTTGEEVTAYNFLTLLGVGT